jgi:hypothetical protein
MLASTAATAQPEAKNFPRAATDFLGRGLPPMEVAIMASDRAYFVSATYRMTRFLEGWGLGGDAATLEC